MDAKIDSAMVIKVNRVLCVNSAAQPTARLARPPKPLNSATISGIFVMATMRAASTPITVPITTPSAIHSKSTMLRSNNVTTTAINIATAEIRLPRRAVAGDPSIFRPTMKSTAASA